MHACGGDAGEWEERRQRAYEEAAAEPRSSTRGVSLWDVGDLARPRLLGGRLLGVTAAFAPRGRVLATAGGGRIWLWDTSDRAHPEPLGPPLRVAGNWIPSVAFSPDGHTLAAAVEQSEIHLWDTRNPAHPKRIGKPLTSTTGDFTDVAFSSDGRILASTNHDEGSFWDTSDPAHPENLANRRTGPRPARRRPCELVRRCGVRPRRAHFRHRRR
ncbi:WD40 repeat domain-containing protein [Streptomyces sp. HUAS TT20]|uniref:WD40 repeat domain-containing protein n=1 Tax=Streptomyces sp. HUAS TT20 TaxID=3447509 RepID=UPI0021DA1408|nr:hypothetical protein [Streptomyces sp. HUAS 15-9]UXY32024.1 hypothetical protein N8I87_39395 [Streptomyces sp. HUAS 15-9]